MRRWLVLAVLALAGGAICLFFGLAILYCVIVVLALVAVGIIYHGLPKTDTVASWPPPPPISIDGTRNDGSQLMWSLRTNDRQASGVAAARIVRLTRRRLARLHLDLDNPAHDSAIRELLGRDLYNLTRDKYSRIGSVSSLARALTSLESLDSPHTPSATPASNAPRRSP